MGHKDLSPTRCPGDTWPNWRPKVISAVNAPSGDQDRIDQITNLYQVILGRSPDQGGLNQYVQSNLTIEAIRKELTESQEHKSILNRANNFASAKTLAAEALARLVDARGKVEEITRLGQ